MNKNKKCIDVKDVFYSAEYEKKAEKINNTEVDATNILDPNFEEKKEELDKTIIKTAEEYKKNKPLRDAMLTNSHICNGEVCPNEDFLNFLKEQEKIKKQKEKEFKKHISQYSGDNFYKNLLPEAIKFIAKEQKASISMLQRKFVIGFSSAARVIDILEDINLISPSDIENPKPREVYFTESDVENILKEKKYLQSKY